MNIYFEEIKKKLVNKFNIENLEIIDNSNKHKRHKNFSPNKFHLHLKIKSLYLSSLPRVNAQKMIMKTLKEDLKEIYNKNLLHPWGDLSELGNDDSSSVIVKGDGIYIFDSDGNRMIDGPAGMWCMQTGYGRREIADAVSQQMLNLSYATSFTLINNKEIRDYYRKTSREFLESISSGRNTYIAPEKFTIES